MIRIRAGIECVRCACMCDSFYRILVLDATKRGIRMWQTYGRISSQSFFQFFLDVRSDGRKVTNVTGLEAFGSVRVLLVGYLLLSPLLLRFGCGRWWRRRRDARHHGGRHGLCFFVAHRHRWMRPSIGDIIFGGHPVGGAVAGDGRRLERTSDERERIDSTELDVSY